MQLYVAFQSVSLVISKIMFDKVMSIVRLIKKKSYHVQSHDNGGSLVAASRQKHF